MKTIRLEVRKKGIHEAHLSLFFRFFSSKLMREGTLSLLSSTHSPEVLRKRSGGAIRIKGFSSFSTVCRRGFFFENL